MSEQDQAVRLLTLAAELWFADTPSEVSAGQVLQHHRRFIEHAQDAYFGAAKSK